MTKQKLLIYCDSPTVKTGFGVVASNLFRDLHEDFQVAILGVNYRGLQQYDTSKYFIYSVEGQDLLGFNRFEPVLEDFKPDKILLFQDVFNIDVVLPVIKKFNEHTPICVYFPIDGMPVSQAWKQVFEVPQNIITYTKWGIDAIVEAHPHIQKDKINYLYHGVDTAVFKKVPNAISKRLREEKNWDNKFVVLSVNRFQPRKALPLLFRAYALFAKGYKICDCGNAYLATRDRCDLNLCDSSHVVEEHPGKTDIMLYLHCNAQEPMMGPGRANLIQAHLLNAGFKDEDMNNILSVFSGNIYKDPVPEYMLNIIYNASDVNISTTLGEGVGLSLVEASATGTTSIAPKNSSIPEMLGDTGYIVPCVGHMNMAFDNGHMRPLVSIPGVIRALEAEYQKWVLNGRKKVFNQAALDRVNELFLWDDKRTTMKKWLMEI